MDGRKEAGFAAEWRYKLTEDEIYDGLRRSGVRRAGPTRDWVQTVVLALVVVFCLIAFFGGGMQEWGSLTIAVLACALIAVLWIVPALRFRYEARESAAGDRTLVVRLDEEGIAFGEEGDAAFPYGGFPVRVFDDMLICGLPGMQLFFLPRRAAADDAQWREAVRRLSGGGR